MSVSIHASLNKSIYMKYDLFKTDGCILNASLYPGIFMHRISIRGYFKLKHKDLVVKHPHPFYKQPSSYRIEIDKTIL